MGSAFSSFKEQRKERKELKRKRKLYRSYVSMSASKRADLIKTKAQMEQKSEALREQISFEERALEMIARSSNPQQLVKSVWSLQSEVSEELTERQSKATDPQYDQFEISEHQRLMFEACQFAQFKREHPLEKWTVGSLPNLSKCSVENCQPRHWEI